MGKTFSIVQGEEINQYLDTTIEVRIRSVYGVERIYPVCDRAKTFAKLVRQKILTMDEIRYIKELGYKVVVVHEINTI